MMLQDSFDGASLDDDSASGSWELFLRHGDVVYALARVLTRDDARAQDLVEDVFVELVRGDAEPDGRSDRDMRLQLLVMVCRRVSAPLDDPCLSRVLRVLGAASDADLARAYASHFDRVTPAPVTVAAVC